MFLFCNEDKKKKERLNSVLKTTHNLIKKNDINRGITFLATDNKNCVLAVIDNDGVCGRRIHTKLKIKIIVHVTLLPTDILHHPRGQ